MAAIGDVYVLRTYCTVFAQTSQNQVHYRVSAITGTGPTDEQIAAVFATGIAQPMKDLIHVGATYWGVQAQKIFPTPVLEAVEDRTGTGVGAGAGDLLPTQTCGILTKSTGLAGRRFRGRLYIPFPPEPANAVTAEPTAGYQASLLVLANFLILPLIAGVAPNTGTLIPVLFHTSGTPRTTDLTSFVVRSKWGTQRSRGAYGNPNAPPAG